MEEIRSIPANGADKDGLLRQLDGLRAGDADWRGGKVWSLVYFAGDEHLEFLEKAHNLFFSENGLNPVAFKSLKRLESEVVRMTATMLNAAPTSVGTMTSGGTESILLAVKAARDRARRRKPWIRHPEMVLPETIHVAFDKAGHYFDVKPRYAPVGPDYRVDVKAMRRLINRNTVLVAASAPQYPHGVVDPIAEIGAITARKRIPFHVDACIGGFVLPWLEKLGHPIPTFDFRVPGVTSMSADVHKYGYSAKGASIIVYRDMSYLKHQFFVSTDWPGGIYASPTMAGTRSGGTIAAAWAAMMAMGESGYLDHARKAMETTRILRAGLAAIAPLEVVGKPDATLVAWRSIDPAVDTYAIADQLEDRGWHIDRQQHPSSVHCTVTSHHLGVVEEYLRDLAAAVAHVRAHPELKSRGNAALYGMMAVLPVRTMVKRAVGQVMEGMYAADGKPPDLGKVGGEEDGPLLKALAKYGPVAREALDRLESVRARLGLKRRGRR